MSIVYESALRQGIARLHRACCACRNCKFYSLIRPFDKDDLRMLAKVAGFFSNQAHHRMAPFELTPGQWQAFGNWFMSYLRLFRCHQQLWMMRSPTAICGFGVDRARAETLLAHQPSVSTPTITTCTDVPVILWSYRQSW